MSSTKIIALIAKLKAHEESARNIGNQEEAEAFAAKVAELLTAHKLSMSEVEFKAQDQDNPIGKTYSPKAGDVAGISLAQALAKHFYCRVLYASGTHEVVFVGRAVDRETCDYTFKFLRSVSRMLSKKEWKARYSGSGMQWNKGQEGIRWHKSFQMGFVAGIASKLQNQADAVHASVESTALMLRDQLAVKEYANQLSRGKAHSRKSASTDYEAYYKGVEHGKNTGLGQQNQFRLGKG
jgi:mannitol/fructose-specific phosphotransferase system IIA component